MVILGLLGISLITLLVFLLYFVMSKQKISSQGIVKPRSLIIVFTTFLTFENRLETFTEQIWPSFVENVDNQYVDRILIINEYDPKATFEKQRQVKEFLHGLQKQHGKVKVLQKTKNQHGQAWSLNYALDTHVPHYEYWMHWEDSWICTKPCIENVLNIMEHNPEITQLSLTDDFHNVEQERKVFTKQKDPRVWVLKPHSKMDSRYLNRNAMELYEQEDWIERWPLFSLRPNIQRVNLLDLNQRFSQNEKLWPVKFEWKYAVEWYKHGGVKALLREPVFKRVGNHKSTYQ